MPDKLSVLFGSPPGETDEESVPESDTLDAAQDECARDVLAAFKRDDPKALRLALRDLLSLMRDGDSEDY